MRNSAQRTNKTAPLQSGKDQSRPVLITGGAGFIGTNVAVSFLEQGESVLILDNLSRPGVRHNLDWLLQRYDGRARLLAADIRDPEPVQNAVQQASCIFHFAAQVAVTSSLEAPRHDFEVNAQGTLNLLEACRGLDSPPPLLFTSTNKVYGNLSDVPLVREETRYVPRDERTRRSGISERQPLDFHSPYGCSKGTADTYVRDYARCYGIPAVVFRMSCIYGPHQWGTEDQGWVAHFVRRILNNDPITVYGDGRQVRDILYVDDLVAAMKLAIENLDVTSGRAFNIGGGPSGAVSLLDVVDELGRRSDSGRPQLVHEEWRQGDQRYYVSDTTAFTEATGWRPSVSVQDGLAALFDWMEENRSGKAATPVSRRLEAQRPRPPQVPATSTLNR